MSVTLKHGSRLTPDNTALLMVDHQAGLVNGVTDFTPVEFKNNVLALSKVGRMFSLPAIITTSAADGPNGPLMSGISDILTDAAIIHRPGEINAFDNKEFADAVAATGRKKLLVAGVSTEVCVAFVVMSALELGYDVYPVLDASGTWNKLVGDAATQRMIQGGAVPVTWVGVAAELQKDWRNPTGHELAAVMGEHLPFYDNLFNSFQASSGNK
ncbi:isochorismatase family protein [Pantoea dispersa]|uniref:isochorismatase family protein n=1 Tax=Pantoea dispersa TaxID=59814 RepID=UPI0028DFB927|nr:isochorismatase family protein [Pantoea dispersa]MDT8849012.1 isochorismatase family protein [Pantoea dispersa]